MKLNVPNLAKICFKNKRNFSRKISQYWKSRVGILTCLSLGECFPRTQFSDLYLKCCWSIEKLLLTSKQLNCFNFYESLPIFNYNLLLFNISSRTYMSYMFSYLMPLIFSLHYFCRNGNWILNQKEKNIWFFRRDM